MGQNVPQNVPDGPKIEPQPGPQEEFLRTTADIAIYGGAAGGGKSYALLLEPLRHLRNEGFGGVIFRRTSPELTGPGSLWDEAGTVYRQMGCEMSQSPNLRAIFPAGGSLHFMHLQHESDVLSHHGKQYAMVGFDELTHFTETQFWYLLGRLRSPAGIRPYMRCTTNPDPDSFVRKLIDWWIGPDGLPVAERSGVLRWFVRRGGALFWADSPDGLDLAPGELPMSLTFIGASLDDNPRLNEADPTYRAKLMALPDVERERLLGGNWDIRPSAGDYIRDNYFQRRWTDIDALPPLHVYTSSDFAATEATPGTDPDYTEHGVFGIDHNDDLYVLDWWFGQTTADVWVDVLLDKWARHKPLMAFCEAGVIRRVIEPFLLKRMRERAVYCAIEWVSSSGSASTSATKQGFSDPSKRAKARRGRAFQARAAMGKVIFPASEPWADRVIQQCVQFPQGHDDAFDVMAQMCLALELATGGESPLPTSRPRESKWDKAFRRSTTDRWKVV